MNNWKWIIDDLESNRNRLSIIDSWKKILKNKFLHRHKKKHNFKVLVGEK